MASPSPTRRHRAGHARRPAPIAVTPASSIAMKRESSIESSVSESRTRVTKRLKTSSQHVASATVHLYIPHATECVSDKLPSRDVVATVTQPKRKRNGHFKFDSPALAEHHARAPSDSSHGGTSSGDEADDEVDIQPERPLHSRSTRRSNESRDSEIDYTTDYMTEVDEDDSEAGYVEMSIVEHVASSSPASSPPITASSFSTSQFFPRFGTTPPYSSIKRSLPDSPLLQVEDMLFSLRDGNRQICSSSSDSSSGEGELNRKKRRKAIDRGGDVSGVEDLMLAVPENNHVVTPEPDLALAVNSQILRQGHRTLIATVSGVTAGLRALTPLNRALRENGSDVEMQSFTAFVDTDGYETDITMKAFETPLEDQHMASSFDTETMMTLDQFTAYRSNRIRTTGNVLKSHALVQKSSLRGQNIQDYLFKLGYTLPIPLSRSVARKKRCLRSRQSHQYKPITHLTGNLREDLLVRGIAKYRRDLLKVYNRNVAVSVEEAARLLETWTRSHQDHSIGAQTASVEAADGNDEQPLAECRALVPYRGNVVAADVNPYVRTYSERLESYEPIYPEAAARYARALLSMLQDSFPAWDRWWSDERRFASRRASWALYDAETTRLESEARSAQESLVRRRRTCARTERLERLGFGGVAMIQGMSTRMDRDEQELVEQALLEARIQQFRSLVNAPPVRLPIAARSPDVQVVSVVPSSPPPSYHSQLLSVTTTDSSARHQGISAVPPARRVSNPIASLVESPPKLPPYQPNTYRRGISPPPPPPFNARSDAIPVRNMCRVLETPAFVGRRLMFDNEEAEGGFPGAYTNRGTMHTSSQSLELPIEAPIAVRPPHFDVMLSPSISAISDRVENEDASTGFDEDEDEEGQELNDLLSEIEEEDEQEQAHEDQGRAGNRLGCIVM